VFKSIRFAAAFLACSTIAVPAVAADYAEPDPAFEARYEGTKPAVSGLNGKIAVGYDFTRYDPGTGLIDYSIPFAEASLSAPIGDQFGVQVDGAIAQISGNSLNITAYGGGAHLFWRNPDMALVGIYGEAIGTSNTLGNYYRIGPEAEIYLDRISIEGFAGVQGGSGGFSTMFSGDLTAAFYPTDNLRLDASVYRSYGVTWGRIGGEALFDLGGTAGAVFANASFGNGFQSYKAGLRFYFGSRGKSLIDRHREDDPKVRITEVISGLSSIAPAPVIEEEEECLPYYPEEEAVVAAIPYCDEPT
jgi:hypothetical protein